MPPTVAQVLLATRFQDVRDATDHVAPAVAQAVVDYVVFLAHSSDRNTSTAMTTFGRSLASLDLADFSPMDTDWSEGVLDWWIKTASSALPRKTRTATISLASAHTRRWPNFVSATTRPAESLLASSGRTTCRWLDDRPGGDFVDLAARIDMDKYALGRLRTDAETRSKIGSTAPTRAADALHPLCGKPRQDAETHATT